MEGGYINEGGQLKTKNGQKYVINDTREGIFISKSCAVLTGITAVLTLIIAILLTYFLVTLDAPHGCPEILVSPTPAPINNGTVFAASVFEPPIIPATVPGQNEANTVGSSSRNGNDNGEGVFFRDEEAKFISKDLKLFEGWNPEVYWLVIEPNLKTLTNNGTVTVEIVKDPKVENLRPIVFDIKNITIDNVKVTRRNKDNTPIAFKTAYGENNETFHIKILSGVDEEALRIEMDFISQLTTTLQGVYKTVYENIYNGQPDSSAISRWVISTQFSPIDARRAFPCFDRPDKKANFSISIVREDNNSMSLSNMPHTFVSNHRPGYIKEDFLMTPKMPTYLVAFIVSNLVKSNYSEIDKHLTPVVEIWTRPEVKHMTKFAYNFVRQILPFYESYFGISYQLPKIDLVCIPDFGFGAMENWGLIKFRDSALLVPEGKNQSSSAAHVEHVASIISHELAHQWFGNLVTPIWWDDLWLKEGFATYMSYLAVDNVKQDWNVLHTFVVNEFQDAMEKDSDMSSHAISFPVSSTGDIRRIFDPISYSKGAVVIRMMNSFLGNEAFQNAVKTFLTQFTYSNALRDDLWKLMTNYGHMLSTLPNYLNVKDIMDSWTLQSGYPVIAVQRSGTDLIITQKKYMLPEKDLSDNTKWYVPITYETDEVKSISSIPTHWLTNDRDSITIHDVFSKEDNADNYVYLNLNRYGYYRVNYDYSSWVVLKKRFKELPPITRAQLLDDALQLARSEYLTYDIPLTFLLEMHSVDDILLWNAAQQGLDYLTYMLSREPAFETFTAFMRFIVKPAFHKYDLEELDNRTHVELMHQARIVKLACKFSYDRCTNPAQYKYRIWMSNSKINMIKPNLKETIYCTALQQGSFEEWYFAYNRYKETMSASEKEQILSALGCTIKPWLLSKYLNMTIDPKSGIRKQDGARAFSAVAKNSIGYDIAFNFLVTNIKEIAEYFGDGFSTLSNMIYSLTTYMNKDYHLEQLEKFAIKAQKLGLKSIERTIELASEKVKNNIFWRSRSYYSLKNYLEKIVEELGIKLDRYQAKPPRY